MTNRTLSIMPSTTELSLIFVLMPSELTKSSQLSGVNNLICTYAQTRMSVKRRKTRHIDN